MQKLNLKLSAPLAREDILFIIIFYYIEFY